jgi:hypothetical protein
MAQVRRPSARIAVLALVTVALSACSAIGRPAVVEGWRIGPEIDCARLPLPLERCQVLQRRAAAYAASTGGPVSSWTMYAAEHVNAEVQPALLISGAGRPDAILLVRQADGYHVALMGCSQPTAPDQAADQACP